MRVSRSQLVKKCRSASTRAFCLLPVVFLIGVLVTSIYGSVKWSNPTGVFYTQPFNPLIQQTFGPGSLIIPMDTAAAGQNDGMLRAYGLVYALLQNGVPVTWVINSGKGAATGDDFTASDLQDLRTGAAITLRHYRGGPFVIRDVDAPSAMRVIAAWQAAAGDQTSVHRLNSGSFVAEVNRTLQAAPRIAILKDGNETIAFNNLNAAGITDALGAPWTSSSPDLLTEADVMGTTGTNHDGALFNSTGSSRYSYLASMHYNTTSQTSAVAAEVRSWLNAHARNHAFMQCESARSFENDANGLFLTNSGIDDDGIATNSPSIRFPSSPLTQMDGMFQVDDGSVDSMRANFGSYKPNVTTLINDSSSSLSARIVMLSGQMDGSTGNGRVTYLAGHDYSTDLPVTSNPQTNGVRLMMNTIFQTDAASSSVPNAMTLTTTAPAITSEAQIKYTITYRVPADSSAIAENIVLTDRLPAGTTYVDGSASPAPTSDQGGVLTWNLPPLSPGSSGSVTFSVNAPLDGIYSNVSAILYSFDTVSTTLSAPSFTVRDTVPPTVIITSGPNGATGNTTPTFEFTVNGSPASTTCSIDNGSPAACSNSYTTAPLSQGPHTFIVQAADAVGNTSSAKRTFEIVQPPTVTIMPWPVNATSDTNPRFSFTVNGGNAGSETFCNVDSESFVSCTSPFTTHVLSEGAHTFYVYARTSAGDGPVVTADFSIDTTAPVITIPVPPNSPAVGTQQPMFIFNVTDASPVTTQCRIDETFSGSCTSSFRPTFPLSTGPHTFYIAAIDAAGNRRDVSFPFRIDTTPPVVTITDGPPQLTNNPQPIFRFSISEPSSVKCRINDEAPIECSSPFTPQVPLANRLNVLTVIASDEAGNTSSAEYPFVVDALPPAASNLSAAETFTEDTVLDLIDIVLSDPNSANLTATLTVSNPSAGKLTTATKGSVTSVYNPATGIWTASGPIADINALLAAVLFVPASDFNNSFTIAVSVSDGANTIYGNKSITGIAVNDPPTSTAPPSIITAENTLVFFAGSNALSVSDVDSSFCSVQLSATNGVLTLGNRAGITFQTGDGINDQTMIFAGSLSNLNVALAALSFNPNPNYFGPAVLTFTIRDEAAAPLTKNISITVIPVNDPPTATNMSAAETYIEDTAIPLKAIVVSDADSTVVAATLTLSNPSAGSLSTPVTGTTASTYDAGAGVWRAAGPISNVNTLLASIVFVPAANFSDNFTIIVNISDGSASISGIKSMTGIPVNDAPVLDAGKSPVLSPEAQNAALPDGPVGTLVSSLVDPSSVPGGLDNVTDPDSSAQLGIAVTAADVTNGFWFYSIDNGVHWILLGSVSNTAARLLAADTSTRIYFQPNSGFSGTIPAAITFRAWDRTTGTQGALASTTPNGGTTAFSTSTDTASLSVTPPSLVSIAVTPVSASVAAGKTLQMTATGTYSDGSTKNVTSTVTWSASPAAVATISNAAGSNGLASGIAAGAAQITAQLGSVSGTTNLTVSAPLLVSISVAPVNSSVTVNQTRQFTATGTYSDGTNQNLTGSVTWSSSAAAVATISNTAGSNGLATGRSTGTSVIKAQSGSISGSTNLTVVNPLITTTTTITCPAAIAYAGTARTPCTATVTGTGLNQSVTVTYTNNVNAGTATANAAFPGNSTYAASTAAPKTFSITKASPACTITGYNVNFDGLTHTAAGSCKGVLNEMLAGLNLEGTTHANPGSYSDTWTFTDVTGNYTGKTGSVTDVIGTLKAAAQAIRTELNNAVSTAANKNDKDNLKDAVAKLDKALDNELWRSDGNHLDCDKGNKVFGREKSAVKKLMNMLDDRSTSNISDATILGWIKILVAADRRLAEIAISESGANSQNRSDANEQFGDGDEDAASADYDKAVTHYKRAWKKVRSCSGNNDDEDDDDHCNRHDH